MAGHNIANVIQDYLHHQERPLYLQPVDASGNYPWMKSEQSLSSSKGRKQVAHDMESNRVKKRCKKNEENPHNVN
jgi:hypothetical protein